MMMMKRGKGRCGLTLQQNRNPKSLFVSAVSPDSLGAEAGFQVGDTLLMIDGLDVHLDMRCSKIKANGVLFDAKGTCEILVERSRQGVARPDDAAASEKEVLKAAATVMEVRATAPRPEVKPSATGCAPAQAVEDPVASAVAAAEAKVSAAMQRAKEEAKAAAAAKAAEREVERLKEVEVAKARMAEAEARARAATAAAAKRREEEAAELAEQIMKLEAQRVTEAASAMTSCTTSSGADESVAASKSFARRDAVLFENPHSGVLELATVVDVDTSESQPVYTVQLCNGSREETGAERLTAALGVKSSYDLKDAPLSYKPPVRIGSGNPHRSRVPALDLTARGIGGNAKSIYGAGKPRSKFLPKFD